MWARLDLGLCKEGEQLVKCIHKHPNVAQVKQGYEGTASAQPPQGEEVVVRIYSEDPKD